MVSILQQYPLSRIFAALTALTAVKNDAAFGSLSATTQLIVNTQLNDSTNNGILNPPTEPAISVQTSTVIPTDEITALKAPLNPPLRPATIPYGLNTPDANLS